jgi:hypothetical protein
LITNSFVQERFAKKLVQSELVSFGNPLTI